MYRDQINANHLHNIIKSEGGYLHGTFQEILNLLKEKNKWANIEDLKNASIYLSNRGKVKLGFEKYTNEATYSNLEF